MYCAPSDIIAAASGHHIAPVWPSISQAYNGNGWHNPGVDKPGQSWTASQCAWVPAYIAYGLLEHVAKEPIADKAGASGEGSVKGKAKLAPSDRDLHEQMLQKLALHLASQPDTQHEELASQTAHLHETHTQQSQEPQVLMPCQSTTISQESSHVLQCQGHMGKDSKSAKGNGVSLHEQEFQQEMLQKLALHLAAQDLDEQCVSKDTMCDSAEASEEIATPDVFPATPSSFGDERCEHYYIGDEDTGATDEEESRCWPACSQCVWVPMHVAYGLLDGIAGGREKQVGRGGKGGNQRANLLAQEEQDFHQQMLQKLALHLAAQAVPLQEVSSHEPAPSLAPKQGQGPKSKVAWADVMDDAEGPEDPAASSQKDCRSRTNGKGRTDGVAMQGAKGKSCSVHAQHTSRPEQQEFQQEMLRKLALHLAAQSESGETPEDARAEFEGDAMAVGQDKARCESLIAELEPSTDSIRDARAAQVVKWVLPSARTLALTESGCRLVQKVIDVASVEERQQLLDSLLQDVTQVYSSPYANHVMAKLVEIMPATDVASIGQAMRGKATTVARHQFGSRILERLVEHCGEEDIGFLLDEVLVDFEALARHQFGNFVVARLLEQSTAARNHTCVQKLLPHVLQHATHKTACNIVQRMLEHADLTCQAMIADTFLAGSGECSLEAIAATRYGSFVVQHLVGRFHPRIDAVKARIKANHSQLQASGFSQRKIVQFLGEAFFRE
jgi:hypothetical protein